jgi:hypothetical protein
MCVSGAQGLYGAYLLVGLMVYTGFDLLKRLAKWGSFLSHSTQVSAPKLRIRYVRPPRRYRLPPPSPLTVSAESALLSQA